MKRIYTAPVILESNGTIHMTTSQLAALGLDGTAEWDQFWEDHSEEVEDLYPGFNVNSQSTWPEGFTLGDPDSWYILIGW